MEPERLRRGGGGRAAVPWSQSRRAGPEMSGGAEAAEAGRRVRGGGSGTAEAERQQQNRDLSLQRCRPRLAARGRVSSHCSGAGTLSPRRGRRPFSAAGRASFRRGGVGVPSLPQGGRSCPAAGPASFRCRGAGILVPSAPSPPSLPSMLSRRVPPLPTKWRRPPLPPPM